MRINNNIQALNTYNRLTINNANLSKSLEKLSSGLRINRAGDDAAGLAISEKMRAQIRGLDQAARNAQDSISLIQTAEGALNEVHSILQRMRELAVQAANDTLTDNDRAEIQKEINQLTSEINRIGNTTEFNTKKLLNGQVGTKVTITNLNVLSNATVTANSVAGNYTVTINGGNAAVYATTGAKKADGSSATLDLNTSNIQTIFSYDAEIPDYDAEIPDFDTNNASLTISQNGKSVNIDLNNSDKIADIIAKMNTAFQAQNMEVSASWDSSNGRIVLTSSKGGTAYDIKVVENNFVTNVTFGFTATTNATDYTITVTNKTTGLSDTVTATSADATLTGLITSGLQEINLTISGTGTTDLTVENNKLDFQIGANANQIMEISISDMRANALKLTGTTSDYTIVAGVTDGTSSLANERGLDVSSYTKATKAISIIDEAINMVSAERSKLGAYQNRLEHTINNLGTASENLTAAESRIRDVDMAKEMMNYTKNNILMQAATAMLAQANQLPQAVLQLLR